MSTFAVGSLVRARGREWVVLPGDDDDLLMLRPLGGGDEETTGLYLPLEGTDVRPASFDPPDPARAGDARTARLLRDALQLGVRSSAGPFRSFGRIAVEPRPYQLVPLLMALRMDPVRLLVADDVGIGKTIEAALVARELLDSGDIRRVAVLCPPHLAEQWQAELASKFHLDAALVLPGTVRRLERGLSHDESLFDRYPHVVVSTDFIKSDRRRYDFARTCPEFVIVDEAHACVPAAGAGGGRQMRYGLLRRLAADRQRHLVLVTATPHSGVDDAFRLLLSLLDETLAALPDDLSGPYNEGNRRRVARHLVQRRRADIRSYADSETPFPDRLEREASYALGREYRALFDRVLAYARESIADPEGGRTRQRVRWWSALALLRSLGSSPAAAAATLRNRSATLALDDPEEVDALGRSTVMDRGDDQEEEILDAAPGADAEDSGDEHARNRRRLLEMARQAEALAGKKDAKLTGAAAIIRELLGEGCRPIVFCRFIPTAEYVAAELRRALRGVEVRAVTGRLPPAEREDRVLALAKHEPRVLVATDCLSEGINLQEHFDAVVHYDLSWNPTRHEQREGRVDRYGQPRAAVRTVTYFGQDNPIDGIVLDVLLRKHRAIRRALGVSVPVPAESESVMEAILQGLVLRGAETADDQLLLFQDAEVAQRKERLHGGWENATERERRSRTMFAQAGIRVEEVAEEARAAREAVGAGADVARFVREAVPALGGTVDGRDGVLRLDLSEVHWDLLDRLDERASSVRTEPPVDEGETLLVRTHPLVETLASYVVDTALDPLAAGVAARCGAMATNGVAVMTTLLLVRFRFHVVTARGGEEVRRLAEEAAVLAFRRMPERAEWLTGDEALGLFSLRPSANLPEGRARLLVTRVVDGLGHLDGRLGEAAAERAAALRDAHRRVRGGAGRTSVTPELPPDILGAYVFSPPQR